MYPPNAFGDIVSTLILRIDHRPLSGALLSQYTLQMLLLTWCEESFLDCLKTFASLETLEVQFYPGDSALLRPIPSILDSLDGGLRHLILRLYNANSGTTRDQFIEAFCSEEVQESFKGLERSLLQLKLYLHETQAEYGVSWWSERIIARSPFLKSLLDVHIDWQSPKG